MEISYKSAQDLERPTVQGLQQGAMSIHVEVDELGAFQRQGGGRHGNGGRVVATWDGGGQVRCLAVEQLPGQQGRVPEEEFHG